MNGHTIYKKISCTILLVGAIALGLGFTSITFSQAQRNPVLEFSTGTWCQWCPCGDQAAQDILAEIPNAIILAYHGPPNSSYDPFSFFAGNTIIYAFDFPGYPTGVVDRLTGIVDYFYGGWAFSMNIRLNVPATVSIDLVNSSYERATREFNATIDFTALQNLSGEYKYSAILVEDGVVYGQSSNQTCTPGQTYISDYVHEWLVRDMMNGPLGEEVINGTWHQNEVITKTVNYAVPVPRAPAPDIVPDSCRVVVIAYKVGSPLSSNAEIQQAEQWPLLDTGTGIDDPTPRVVNSFALKPNYPNPFNPETCISYDLPPIEGDQRLSLLIYDQLGQKVRTLVNETQSAGSYEVMWNGRDDQGRLTVSGVYFYKLQYGKYQQTRKLILLR